MIDMVNLKVAGANSELVVKVFGEDFGQLRPVAEQIKSALEQVPGSADVSIDQQPSVPQIQIKVDRGMAARYGINMADIAELIQNGIGGGSIGDVFVGERRYDLTVRFKPDSRETSEAIGKLPVMSSSGAQISLDHVANIELAHGETTISREMGKRHITVKLNLRGSDLSSFLASAHKAISEKVEYDHSTVDIQWGGQFESQQRAQAKLALILPLTLLIMFALLFAEFRNMRHPSLILLAVPLSAVGGLIALHLRGMTLNISSAVGFIALFGVSVQNAIIMVANLNKKAKHGNLGDGVVLGAAERFRPVLMTATVAALGLFPASIARGLGSDIQRPLATVVVSGLITATALTLIVLPVLYSLIERRHQAKYPGQAQDESQLGLAKVLNNVD
jgi:cobalt-zinc-cadmium resistance protein CzcA